jgi:hypothetical protein
MNVYTQYVKGFCQSKLSTAGHALSLEECMSNSVHHVIQCRSSLYSLGTDCIGKDLCQQFYFRGHLLSDGSLVYRVVTTQRTV